MPDPMTSASSEPSSPFLVRRDTQATPPPRTINPVGGVIGGVLGGVLGTFAGAFLGGATAEGCQGEDCGLVNVILGAGIGESIGVGLGAHVGSGSQRHENILLTSLTSAGILVGGTLLGVAMNNAGVVMLPLTPALQLAATLAIERY